ncbi:hypothetical protein FBQ81_19285 [Chloroflexi bacterium CFX6]|nr:hypothetical protein [Chloroflexi bacterium CFX6]
MSRKPTHKPEEIKIGKVTFVSSNEGAFVQLLSEREGSAEVFVPNNIIAKNFKSPKLIRKNELVQLKRSGQNILEISPF